MNTEKITINTHSSIRIEGSQVLYFDPFEIEEASKDADVILVTHDHFDHFSPESIEKLQKECTLLICPESMKEKALAESGISKEHIYPMKQTDVLEVNGLLIKTIPAYNVGKKFHTKEMGYVGYLVEMDEKTYYVAGDTDRTPEAEKVICDVAFLPVGGTYTMDETEAAQLTKQLQANTYIPTHFGTVAGDPEAGKRFLEKIEKK